MAAKGSHPRKLNIGIVGAGIAGLTTAIALRTHELGPTHDVTVFEKYGEFQTRFSGPIQLSPNATKILTRLGVREAIERCLPDLRSVNNAHRYADGKLLLSVPAESLNNAFGSPVWNISRHHLRRILLERAILVGAVVNFNTTVRDIDTNKPCIMLDDGESRDFDLVIGADGIRSPVRFRVLGQDIKPACAVTAYSFNVPRKLIAADPELRFLLHRSGFWNGPRLSINQMDMPDFDDSCNFVFSSETAEGKEGEWDTVCDIDIVKTKFAGFEPRLHKILEMADTGACYIWRLSDIPALESWQSKSGRTALIGDAAHAVLPFAAMGAACGVEDALCLAQCLARLESLDDVPQALIAYEAIRKPRTSFVAEVGRRNMRMVHLPDGPEQEARDASFAKVPGNQAVSNTVPAPAATVAASDPSQDLGPKKLEDFDPPEPDIHPFSPAIRKYLMAYDVMEHTRLHLESVS